MSKPTALIERSFSVRLQKIPRESGMAGPAMKRRFLAGSVFDVEGDAGLQPASRDARIDERLLRHGARLQKMRPAVVVDRQHGLCFERLREARGSAAVHGEAQW